MDLPGFELLARLDQLVAGRQTGDRRPLAAFELRGPDLGGDAQLGILGSGDNLSGCGRIECAGKG